AADGAVVTSGQLLAVLEPGDVAAAGAAAAAPKQAAKPQAQVAPAAAPAAAPAPVAESAAARSSAGTNKMGPAVRKLVEQHDLDPAAIAGSGREGRITKGDVLDYIADHQATTVGIDHDLLEQDEDDGGGAAPRVPGGRTEQRVAMTRLRARIAERLVQAQQTAAMLTTFNEADMSAVMALRSRYQEQFQKRYG